MLSQLTAYLIQHGRVCIPRIGTFEIDRQPTRLDVAARTILPPSFTTRFLHKDEVGAHQAAFLQERAEEIEAFGQQLRLSIQHAPFHWNGFGILKEANATIVFEPAEIYVPGLNEVPAEKILREDAQHNLLVGDQQMTSGEMAEALAQPEKLRPPSVIIGWVLFILTVLAIIILLYLGKFDPSASGMRR